MSDVNIPTFEIVGNISSKKAALVNLTTNIIENIIMVNTFEDPVPENYKLVKIPLIKIETPISEEEKQLLEIIKEIDPEFPEYIINNVIEVETPIHINITKWTKESGFYEE